MGRLTKDQIITIADPKFYKTAIETGTWKGGQLAILTQVYKNVIGVELDPHYYQESKNNAPQAKMYNADSRTYLNTYLTDEDCVFLLDSHYCKLDPPIPKSEFPLWDELQILSERLNKDVIIIDDVHNFGVKREDLLYTKQSKEWEHVTEKEIMKYFPEATFGYVDDSFVIWK